jgi:hypothetical protein
VPDAPYVKSLDAEPLELKAVEILQVQIELDDRHGQATVPLSFHPTIPPTATLLGYRAAESPWGPFTLAQLRIGARAGLRPRAYLLGAVIDNEEAGKALAERWGYGCRAGRVRLRKFYDRVDLTVEVDGRLVLDTSLLNPEPVSGSDVSYFANANLARVQYEGEVKPRLLQVDPEYTFLRAERGKPLVRLLDGAAWGDERVGCTWPISASYAVCDLTLPKLRFVTDPALPVSKGTERVNEP